VLATGKLRLCVAKLGRHYGLARHGNQKAAISDLFYLLLSRQTTEQNFQAAYRNLRRLGRSWESLLEISNEQLYAAVKVAGFGRQRAREIRAIADRLKIDFGRVTLAPLSRSSTRVAEKYLITLPGVGKKTARCVLMYAFDRRVFPVDVHCYRILNRLGIISCKGPVRKHEDLIQTKVPPQLRLRLHVTLVSLGRDVCHSTNPECHRCPLGALCTFKKTRSSIGRRRQGTLE
jgi:endonuclease III